MRTAASGLTLAETVMAMSVTLVIGLAVAGVGSALSNVQASSDQYYKHMHNGRVATIRLQATVRKAQLVTAASSGALLIWATDERSPGQINVSEIVSVYRDPATRQLIERSIVFPDTMSGDLRSMLDTVVPLSAVTDISVADNPIGPAQYDLQRVLAHDVDDFEVYCDTPAPLTRMVKFRLTVGDNADVVRVHGGAALRADKVADVGKSGDDYVLSP